jgi:hypothetical protein
VRLTELEPRWIPLLGNAQGMVMFQCPHCRSCRLTCTFVESKVSEQQDALEAAGVEDAHEVVPCKRLAWGRAGAGLEDLSVTPSLDASPAGHWHGFITNGEIVGGAIAP